MTRPPATTATPTCPKYQPTPGSRRCRHYVTNGACALPDEFMCVEWLRANGHTASPVATPAPREREIVDAAPASPVLDAAALATIATLGAEVRAENEDLGELWLVPTYTGLDRLELSFEHAEIVARLCAAMPTTRVTALVRSKRSPSA